ncbi:DUF2313 domain-containing protein [bacterium 1XD42-8]|nr:DUF2313 domain-containing protein [bacterium 1XD42-8]
MNTDLRKYYPPIYEKVLEMEGLAQAENKAFTILDRETERVEKNQYILTSDELGIEIWERALQIQYNPEEDTLDFRKKRILNRLQDRTPITYGVLVKKLNFLLGRNTYELSLEQLVLTLVSHTREKNSMDEVLRTLIQMLPCNIALKYDNNLPLNTDTHLYYGGTHTKEVVHSLSPESGLPSILGYTGMEIATGDQIGVI